MNESDDFMEGLMSGSDDNSDNGSWTDELSPGAKVNSSAPAIDGSCISYVK